MAQAKAAASLRILLESGQRPHPKVDNCGSGNIPILGLPLETGSVFYDFYVQSSTMSYLNRCL